MSIFAPLSSISGGLISQPHMDQLNPGVLHDANGLFLHPEGCLDATPLIPAGAHRTSAEWLHDGERCAILCGHKSRPGVL